MPRWTSMPCGLFACSAGIGQSWGAWSLQVTWQMKEHSVEMGGGRVLDGPRTLMGCRGGRRPTFTGKALAH